MALRMGADMAIVMLLFMWACTATDASTSPNIAENGPATTEAEAQARPVPEFTAEP